MMYTLSNPDQLEEKKRDGVLTALGKLFKLMSEEKGRLALSFVAILANSGLTILAPIIVGHAVDKYIVTKDFHGVLVYSGWLLLTFLGSMASSFLQTRIMGGVGQRVLFRLRNEVFNKLQELPVAFFNQNKAGDLISRINNDTDKLNQFFPRSLMQFVGNIFVIIGAGIAMIVVNHKLGGAALIPALALLIFTQLTSAWIKRKNFQSLQTLGGMSSEIQESLNNFKVIIAFNRRDYFRERFTEVNNKNYKAALVAGVANNTYVPVFGFASSLGQLIVITYGLSLISTGALTFGLLISYLAYVVRFYDPLRQMASLWSDLQVALAGWDRIEEILSLKSDLVVVPSEEKDEKGSLIEFRNVAFSYPGGKNVLHDINFKLEAGKTYALVGPTGGGKTTTASLIARLYDPSEGTVLLEGKDIRSYETAERTKKIGFILQDPFLFSGTIRDNILYGNEEYQQHTNQELEAELKKDGLEHLLSRFDQGLDTAVTAGGETISLGQKQLIAFIRAVLRHPDLLILDEATANIDTVTEQLLEDILKRLPKETTRVVIAHRLNTIENADEIFFVNGGTVTAAGSLDDAVRMLSKGSRIS
jgi:ATP-binding cassette subfamily B protein